MSDGATSGGTEGEGCAIPERLLARLWQRRAARQSAFKADSGRRVRVLYPGRAGQSQGPDFRDAVLEVEGVGLVQGDVELHVSQGDWQRHGHQGDPAYNRVALHAVLRPDGSKTQLASGQAAPVVSLEPLLTLPDAPETAASPELWSLLARWGYPRPATSAEAGALLDKAGDARFAFKSSRFAVFLAEQAPEQTLYESLLEGLGYRPNQQAFLRLATRAPWAALAQAAHAFPASQRPAVIEGWLLYLAGLLPAEEVAQMKLPRAGFGKPLSAEQWHKARLRPANQPRRRAAGAARLVARFLDTGLIGGLRQATLDGRPRALAAALAVDSTDGGPAYIGLERAADLAVNVALPFLRRLAEQEGNLVQTQRFQRLYRQVPRLQDNELTRELAEQLLAPEQRRAVNSARRQQGLLHLHHLLAGGG